MISSLTHKKIGEAWIDGKLDPDLSGGASDFGGVNNVMRWAERMAHFAIDKGVPWITVDANKKVWAVDPDNAWTEPALRDAACGGSSG